MRFHSRIARRDFDRLAFASLVFHSHLVFHLFLVFHSRCLVFHSFHSSHLAQTSRKFRSYKHRNRSWCCKRCSRILQNRCGAFHSQEADNLCCSYRVCTCLDTQEDKFWIRGRSRKLCSSLGSNCHCNSCQNPLG